MRQKMSGRPPQPEKAEAGGPFFIFCIPVLDNPHTTVYNKDKERRCPHSGQLPSLSVTLENMTAEVWDAWGGHFSCHYFFE